MEAMFYLLLCVLGCFSNLGAWAESSCLDDPEGQCSGWRLIPGGQCVLVPDAKANFPKAKVECARLGGRLVELETMEAAARSCMLEQHPHKRFRMIWVDSKKECTLHDLASGSNRSPGCSKKRYFACQKEAMLRIQPTEPMSKSDVGEPLTNTIAVRPTITLKTQTLDISTTDMSIAVNTTTTPPHTPVPVPRSEPTPSEMFPVGVSTEEAGSDFRTDFGTASLQYERYDTTPPRTYPPNFFTSDDFRPPTTVPSEEEHEDGVSSSINTASSANATQSSNIHPQTNSTDVIHVNHTNDPNVAMTGKITSMHHKPGKLPPMGSPSAHCKLPGDLPPCPEHWLPVSSSLCLYVNPKTKGTHSEANYDCIDQGGELLSVNDLSNDTSNCLHELFMNKSSPMDSNILRLAGGKCLSLDSREVSICASDRTLAYICAINHDGNSGRSTMGAGPVAGMTLAATTIAIFVYHTLKVRNAR